MNKVIKVNRLIKSYKQKLKSIKALNEMTFDIKEKEICGFLGPNGAGKSTTLKIIMDFIRPDSGSVILNGIDSKDTNARKHIGFMPENPPYIDSLTGKELLLLSAKMHNIDSKEATKKSNELLNKLDLEKSASKKLRYYSKGMIQRVGFAASLIVNPKILILDEPMSGLDPIGRYKFKNMIKEVQEKGTTVFFSSHIIADIEDICDRVIIVNNGKVVREVDENMMKIYSLEGYKIIIDKQISAKTVQSTKIKSGLEMIETNKNDFDKTLNEIKQLGAKIIAIDPIKKDLEQLFVELVEK